MCVSFHSVLPVDLSDPEATRAATKKAKNIFGKIDILVNNAGVYNVVILASI